MKTQKRKKVLRHLELTADESKTLSRQICEIKKALRPRVRATNAEVLSRLVMYALHNEEVLHNVYTDIIEDAKEEIQQRARGQE